MSIRIHPLGAYQVFSPYISYISGRPRKPISRMIQVLWAKQAVRDKSSSRRFHSLFKYVHLAFLFVAYGLLGGPSFSVFLHVGPQERIDSGLITGSLLLIPLHHVAINAKRELLLSRYRLEGSAPNNAGKDLFAVDKIKSVLPKIG